MKNRTYPTENYILALSLAESICTGGDPSNMTINLGTDTAAAADIFYQWEKSTTSAAAGFAAISGICHFLI